MSVGINGRVGRGGWTWYTGAAGWMYRVWIEEMLGMKIQGDEMTLDPVIPADWPGFSLRYRCGQAVYEITVERAGTIPDTAPIPGRGVLRLALDGRPLAGTTLPLERAFIKHRVKAIVGAGRREETTSGPD
jgi:cyclic beta-1,2-glucan synthetase